MLRKLSLVEYAIILIGLISLWLGVQTMLETPTVILSAWFLVIMYGSILLLLAFGLGVLIVSLTKSKVHLLTAASFIVTIVCLAFYISEFRPTYKIYVTESFNGEVKLFRSTLNKNKLLLSKYGVGYITDKAYREGFKPIIYQNGKDITKECKSIVQGSVAFASIDGTSFGPFPYVGFTIGDTSVDTIWNNLTNIVEMKIIDTTILKR